MKITHHTLPTFCIAVWIALCLGVAMRRISADSLKRGSTEMKMRVAMKSEQMGSAINHPNCSTKTEEMMTPTLPIVSAKTCRNTPLMFVLWAWE